MGHGSTRLSIAGASTRVKTIARAVADSNQSLTGVPGGSIDGVGSWVASQVILLTGQTDASENGLWRVSSGAWARTSDLSTGRAAQGASTFASEGTSHGNKSWQCTNDASDDIVGTHDLVWAVGGGTTYTHPTSAGNKHVPAGGSSGQFLKYSSDGTAVWAADNDTVYTHPTSAGNKHIPSGGASGEFLKYDSAGTAVWADDNDTVYTHPTSAGNKHIPSGGASGEFLKYDSAGTAVWADDNDTVYTHPTSAGNKHVPAGGAADQVLTYSSDGTAVWAAAAGGGSTPSYLDLLRNDASSGKRRAYVIYPSSYPLYFHGTGYISYITETESGSGPNLDVDDGGMHQEFLTGTSTNDESYFKIGHYYYGLTPEADFLYWTRFGLSHTSDLRFFAGMTHYGQVHNIINSDDYSSQDWAGIQFSTARGDTNFQFVTRKSSVGQTLVDTGVAPDTAKSYDFEMEFSSGGTSCRMRLTESDGTIVCSDETITTNLPTSTQFDPGYAIRTLTTAEKGFKFYRTEAWI